MSGFKQLFKGSRGKTVRFLFLLSLVFSPGAVTASNLIVNPGFEDEGICVTTAEDWIFSSLTWRSNSQARTADWSVEFNRNLQNDYNDTWKVITPTAQVTSGDTYTFGAWGYLRDTLDFGIDHGDYTYRVQIQWLDEDDQELGLEPAEGSAFTLLEEWEEFSLSAEAPADTESARLIIQALRDESASEASVFTDDVFIRLGDGDNLIPNSDLSQGAVAQTGADSWEIPAIDSYRTDWGITGDWSVLLGIIQGQSPEAISYPVSVYPDTEYDFGASALVSDPTGGEEPSDYSFLAQVEWLDESYVSISSYPLTGAVFEEWEEVVYFSSSSISPSGAAYARLRLIGKGDQFGYINADDAFLRVTPPEVTGASTDQSGTLISIEFDREMGDPSGEEGSFSYSINEGPAQYFSEASRDENFFLINLTVDGDTVSYGDTVTLTYTPGEVTTEAGGVLGGFSDLAVENNVPPVPASISPESADYSLYSPGDIETSVTWNDAVSISTVTVGEYTLIKGPEGDYDITGEGSTLTVFDTYLSGELTAAGEFLVLLIEFERGEPTELTITAIDVDAGNSSVSLGEDTVEAGELIYVTMNLADTNDDPVSGNYNVRMGDLYSAASPFIGGSVLVSFAEYTAGIYEDVPVEVEIRQDTWVEIGDFTLTVTAAEPSAGYSSIAADPVSGLTADGVDSSTLTITLRDMYGNLCSAGGDTVFLSAPGILSAVTDNEDGTYEATLSTTVASSVTVTAHLEGPGGPVIGTVDVTFVPGDPDAGVSEVTASPGSDILAGVEVSTITVTVRDAQGNIRSAGGDDVYMEVLSGDGELSVVTDNGDGTYTAQLTSDEYGFVSVRAYLGVDSFGDPAGEVDIKFTEVRFIGIAFDRSFSQTGDGSHEPLEEEYWEGLAISGLDEGVYSLYIDDGEDRYELIYDDGEWVTINISTPIPHGYPPYDPGQMLFTAEDALEVVLGTYSWTGQEMVIPSTPTLKNIDGSEWSYFAPIGQNILFIPEGTDTLQWDNFEGFSNDGMTDFDSVYYHLEDPTDNPADPVIISSGTYTDGAPESIILTLDEPLETGRFYNLYIEFSAVRLLDGSGGEGVLEKYGEIYQVMRKTEVTLSVPRPGRVDTLHAEPSGLEGGVILSWEAPGTVEDLSALEEGSLYAIQYSTWAGVEWSASAAVEYGIAESTHGVTPGDLVSHSLYMEDDREYFFKIWHKNHFDIWSSSSNLVSAAAVSNTGVIVDGAEPDRHLTPGNNARGMVRTSSGDLYMVYVKDDGGYKVFVSSSGDNGASWHSSEVAYAGEGPSAPSVAVDSEDRIHVVWAENSEGGSRLSYITSEDGENWSAVSLITEETGDDYGWEMPSVTADFYGGLHVIWQRGLQNTDDRQRVLYISSPAGEGWDSERTAIDYLPEVMQQWPALTVDSRGDIHAVWSQERMIRYSRNEEGQWSAPVNIGDPGDQLARDPSIAVCPQDNIHILWSGNDSQLIFEKRYSVSQDRGISWSAPEYIIGKLGHNQSRPSLAADREGNLHAVWRGRKSAEDTIFQILYTYFDAGSGEWEQNITVFTAGAEHQLDPVIRWSPWWNNEGTLDLAWVSEKSDSSFDLRFLSADTVNMGKGFLPPVKNLTGAADSESRIDWSWDPVDRADNYRVMDASDGEEVHDAGGDTEWAQEGLSPNASNHFYIKASDDYYSSVSESEIVFSLAAEPSGINVSGIFSSSATVSWNAGLNPDYTMWRVERSTDSAFNHIQLSTVTPGAWDGMTVSFTDTALKAETTYYWQVAAINGNGIQTGFDGPAEGATLEPGISIFLVEFEERFIQTTAGQVSPDTGENEQMAIMLSGISDELYTLHARAGSGEWVEFNSEYAEEMGSTVWLATITANYIIGGTADSVLFEARNRSDGEVAGSFLWHGPDEILAPPAPEITTPSGWVWYDERLYIPAGTERIDFNEFAEFSFDEENWKLDNIYLEIYHHLGDEMHDFEEKVQHVDLDGPLGEGLDCWIEVGFFLVRPVPDEEELLKGGEGIFEENCLELYSVGRKTNIEARVRSIPDPVESRVNAADPESPEAESWFTFSIEVNDSEGMFISGFEPVEFEINHSGTGNLDIIGITEVGPGYYEVTVSYDTAETIDITVSLISVELDAQEIQSIVIREYVAPVPVSARTVLDTFYTLDGHPVILVEFNKEFDPDEWESIGNEVRDNFYYRVNGGPERGFDEGYPYSWWEPEDETLYLYADNFEFWLDQGSEINAGDEIRVGYNGGDLRVADGSLVGAFTGDSEVEVDNTLPYLRHYAVAETDPGPHTAGEAIEVTLTVRRSDDVKDAGYSGLYDVTVSGYLPAPLGGLGSFDGVSFEGDSTRVQDVDFSGGEVSADLILFSALLQEITFSLEDVSNPDTLPVSITPLPASADHLVVATQPVAGQRGDAEPVFAVQPVVLILDEYGNIADSAQTIEAAVSAGDWTLGGETQIEAVSGVAAFTDLTHNAAEDVFGAVIRFSDPLNGFPDVFSDPFDILDFPVPGLISPEDGKHVDDNNVVFKWSDAVPASNFKLQVTESGDGGFAEPSVDWTGGESEYQKFLSEGEYIWRVKGVYGEDESAWSDHWAVTVDTTAPRDVEFKVVELTTGNVLTYSLLAEDNFTPQNEIGFSIYFSTRGAYEEVEGWSAKVTGTQTITTPGHINPNTTWWFWTQASDRAGNTELSPWVSTVTYAVQPDGLYVYETFYSSVTISWDSDGNPEGTLYSILRSTDNITYDIEFRDTGDYVDGDIFFTDTGLEKGKTYYYKVAAVNLAGILTPDTGPVSVTMPDWPDLVSPGDGYITKADEVEFNWSAVDGASGYEFAVWPSGWEGAIGDFVLLSTGTTAIRVNVPDEGKDIREGSYYWSARALYELDPPTRWADPFEILIDTTPPLLLSASVEPGAPDELVLIYSEDLDGGSVPDPGDFSIGGEDGGELDVTSVDITESAVTLGLSALLSYGDGITLSYTRGANPLRDPAGNEAGEFTGESVTNNISAVLKGVVSYEGSVDTSGKNLVVALWLSPDMETEPDAMGFVESPLNFPVQYEVTGLELGADYYMVSTVFEGNFRFTEADPWYIHKDRDSLEEADPVHISEAETLLDFTLRDDLDNPLAQPAYDTEADSHFREEYDWSDGSPRRFYSINVSLDDRDAAARVVALSGPGIDGYFLLESEEDNGSLEWSTLFSTKTRITWEPEDEPNRPEGDPPYYYTLKVYETEGAYPAGEPDRVFTATVTAIMPIVTPVEPEPYTNLGVSLSRLAWDEIDSASGYRVILYDTGPENDQQNEILDSGNMREAEETDLPALTPGSYYFYRVFAWDSGRNSSMIDLPFSYRAPAGQLLLTAPGETREPRARNRGKSGAPSVAVVDSTVTVRTYASNSIWAVDTEFDGGVVLNIWDGSESHTEGPVNAVEGVVEYEISFNAAGSYYLHTSAAGLDDSVVTVMEVIELGIEQSIVSEETQPELPVAGNEFALSVSVRDSEGNPVSGLEIQDFNILSGGTGALILKHVQEDGETGEYTLVAEYSKAEIIDISVYVGGVAIGSVEVRVIPAIRAELEIVRVLSSSIDLKVSATDYYELSAEPYAFRISSYPPPSEIFSDTGWTGSDTHTWSGLSEGTTYWFAAVARDASGNFGWSQVLSTVTLSIPVYEDEEYSVETDDGQVRLTVPPTSIPTYALVLDLTPEQSARRSAADSKLPPGTRSDIVTPRNYMLMRHDGTPVDPDDIEGLLAGEEIILQINYPEGLTVSDINKLRVVRLNEADEEWEFIERDKLTVNRQERWIQARLTSLSVYSLVVEVYSDIGDVYVYPNPLKPGDPDYGSVPGGGIMVGNLTEKADIRIFSIAGELVDEISHSGGNSLRWAKADDLASGVYIMVITSGGDTETVKFAVVK